MKTTINKIGFEIEAEMSDRLMEELRKKRLGSIVSDGSIERCPLEDRAGRHNRTHLLSASEFRGYAFPYDKCGRRNMRKVFKILQKYYLKKEYHWNHTMGFHIHFSFNPKTPVEIWSLQFAEYFYTKMRKKFKPAWDLRGRGSWSDRYCRVIHDEKVIANGEDRFTAINFRPAFKKHGTIEFRIFPADSPMLMSQYLRFAFLAVNSFIKNSSNLLSREFNFSPEDEPRRREVGATVNEKPREEVIQRSVLETIIE